MTKADWRRIFTLEYSRVHMGILQALRAVGNSPIGTNGLDFETVEILNAKWDRANLPYRLRPTYQGDVDWETCDIKIYSVS